MSDFSQVALLLQRAVAGGAFPGATAEAGTAAGPLWTGSFGRLTYDPESAPVDANTIYDLASLTKPVATGTLAMRAVDEGVLHLEAPLTQYMPQWKGEDRAGVTVADLLEHASGLTGYLPFFRDLTGRAEFQPAICATTLEYPPRSQSVYSDLGFMLLGFILEDVRGQALGLQFARLSAEITPEPLAFHPPRAWRDRIAPTEMDAWRGHVLVGEVQDENAWALGGAAGHAGLFGTAAALGAFAREVLQALGGSGRLAHPETVRRFIQPSTVLGSSRALAWDTMLPTSSCGTRMSAHAVGHTGFTGTSLWIDWERDLYVVLLTNRVHPTRENDRIQEIRPAFHDAVIDAL